MKKLNSVLGMIMMLIAPFALSADPIVDVGFKASGASSFTQANAQGDQDLIIVRERFYGAEGVDLTAYSLGNPDFVQSILFRPGPAAAGSARTRGTVQVSGATIHGVIVGTAPFGADPLLMASNSEFGVTTNLLQDGLDVVLSTGSDYIRMLDDQSFEFSAAYSNGFDDFRVILDYGDAFPDGATLSVTLDSSYTTSLGVQVGLPGSNVEGSGDFGEVATVSDIPLTPDSCASCSVGSIVGIDSAGDRLVYATLGEAFGSTMVDDLETILVCEGTYDENPTLYEADGLDILACGDVIVRGMTFRITSNVRVSGFEVVGDGISIGFGAPYVNDNILIEDCDIHDSSLGVFVQADNSNIAIDNCTIENNYNGIVFDVAGGPYEVTNCEISGSGNQGAVAGPDTEVLFQDNFIHDNTWFGIVREWAPGGGSPQTITLDNNIFSGNGGFTIPGTHDENLGHYDQIIDTTDNQPGY